MRHVTIVRPGTACSWTRFASLAVPQPPALSQPFFERALNTSPKHVGFPLTQSAPLQGASAPSRTLERASSGGATSGCMWIGYLTTQFGHLLFNAPLGHPLHAILFLGSSQRWAVLAHLATQYFQTLSARHFCLSGVSQLQAGLGSRIEPRSTAVFMAPLCRRLDVALLKQRVTVAVLWWARAPRVSELPRSRRLRALRTMLPCSGDIPWLQCCAGLVYPATQCCSCRLGWARVSSHTVLFTVQGAPAFFPMLVALCCAHVPVQLFSRCRSAKRVS